MQTTFAPAGVLRAVAHELRQPLSAIESIAYYLKLVLPPDDPKIHGQLDQLQRLVEQSNWILSSGLRLTDPSPAAPRAIDLEALIRQTISSSDPSPTLDFAPDLPLVTLDPSLGRALIDNLLTLFRQAGGKVMLRTSVAVGGGVMLEVCTDAGALGAGSALSVEYARRIVEEHGGSLELNVDAARGIRLAMVLP